MAKKLSDFQTQKRNLNKHRPRAMGMLDNIISKEGWIGAITVANDGETFAGSARLETAQERFGDESEPIVFDIDGTRPVILRRTDIPTADDPRAIRLGIADNRISELNYDPDIELLSAIAEEVDISDMYFEDELAALVEADQREDEEYPDQKEEEDEDELERSLDNVGKVESRVKLGEIWQLGRHKIACGDSTVEANVRALLGDLIGDVGMVWSDPPYGINLHTSYKGSKKGTRTNYAPVIGDEDLTTVTKCFSVCEKLKAVSIWWGANHYCHLISPSPCWIVWDKKEEGDNEISFADCELAWSNASKQARIFKHLWRGFRRDSEQGETRTHPTQKPIALCEWAFDKYGQSDDVIFDPFLGSAPSIIAAQKIEGDRTVYGFELSPDYCEVIIQRYENFTGDIAKLVGRLP